MGALARLYSRHIDMFQGRDGKRAEVQHPHDRLPEKSRRLESRGTMAPYPIFGKKMTPGEQQGYSLEGVSLCLNKAPCRTGPAPARRMKMKLKLQELRIPAGWFVSYNQFYDIAPSEEAVESIDTVFTQDILQFENKFRNRLIDLGWYPEGDYRNGAYRLVVYEGDFLGNLLYELTSRDKREIVSEINRLLSQVTDGCL